MAPFIQRRIGHLPDNPNRAERYRLSALADPAALAGLAIIGIVVLCVVGAFAYVAGWLSPGRLTPARIIDAFEQVNGPHPGFRRNHAKGVCFSGYFDGNGQGARLSRAVVFRSGRTPVVGRFALAGGMPFMADGPKAVRSMAVSFRPPGGEEWRTGMNDIPVFPVNTAEGFYQQLLASRPDPSTGKPNPAAMKTFLAAHPETARALKAIGASPFSSGFADADYNSLNAFRFINAAGAATPVRWSMMATEPLALGTGAPPAAADKNYLFDALVARIGQGPLHWRLVVTVGQAGDPTNDATVAWPADRPHIDVGVLTIDRIQSEASGNCQDINFDPLVLPAGIAPSDDPLLSARSAAYSQSFTRRAGEKKPPSAVQAPSTGRPG
jgi:catalase